ncbi:unnamed protein product, partial [Amoebophrya sp. A25]|eukprot:GSA25T00006370001.1
MLGDRPDVDDLLDHRDQGSASEPEGDEEVLDTPRSVAEEVRGLPRMPKCMKAEYKRLMKFRVKTDRDAFRRETLLACFRTKIQRFEEWKRRTQDAEQGPLAEQAGGEARTSIASRTSRAESARPDADAYHHVRQCVKFLRMRHRNLKARPATRSLSLLDYNPILFAEDCIYTQIEVMLRVYEVYDALEVEEANGHDNLIQEEVLRAEGGQIRVVERLRGRRSEPLPTALLAPPSLLWEPQAQQPSVYSSSSEEEDALSVYEEMVERQAAEDGRKAADPQDADEGGLLAWLQSFDYGQPAPSPMHTHVDGYDIATWAKAAIEANAIEDSGEFSAAEGESE